MQSTNKAKYSIFILLMQTHTIVVDIMALIDKSLSNINITI